MMIEQMGGAEKPAMFRWLTRLLFLTAACSMAAYGGEMTIVAFGDSTTATRDTVARVYADRLPALLVARGVEARVINAGVGGSHTGRLLDNARHRRKHALDRLDEAVRNQKPDVVVVQFGWNDSWIDSNEPDGPSRIPVRDYAANLKRIVETLERDGSKVILMTPNRPNTGIEPWRVARTQQYVDVVRKLAVAGSISLVDVWAEYDRFSATQGQSSDDLLLDSVHPNDKGHELVARRLADLIGNLGEGMGKRRRDGIPLLPFPQEVSWGSPDFTLQQIRIQADEGLDYEAEILRRMFLDAGTKATQVSKKGNVVLKLANAAALQNEEGYTLSVTANQVALTAPSPAGIFYGIQTIRQLISEDGKMISGCTIKDWPLLKMRGFMHDVGRNYQSPELLKEQIEIMARYKYNVFHMHISDNPGWRLESKRYPQVNKPETMTRKADKVYTQEAFRDLVRYCRKRHITLIPELEMPGHSEAFRKAFNVKSMKEPRVQKILIELLEELCDLIPAKEMPYTHLGTDEAREPCERVNPETFLPPIYQAVRARDRKIISWMEGMVVKGDTETINQLWARYKPHKGHMCIDSRANYLNHLDPFCAPVRLFFQKPGWGIDSEQLLGGTLCVWPDNNLGDERNVLRQNPVYSSIVAYSEAVWTGIKEDKLQYWAMLPDPATPEFNAYVEFENRLIANRNRFFKGREFFYLRQSHIPWRLIRFPSTGSGKNKKEFPSYPVEEEIREYYQFDGRTVRWLPREYRGATIHLKHFFGLASVFREKTGTAYALNYIHSPKSQTVGFWIGFCDWSRSSGRRGGPFPRRGQWLRSNPRVWINDREVAPPTWKNPGLGTRITEVPWSDENY
jgi:lysophospholipase L1-like esterase